jgi:hypothetical protein
VTGPVGLGYSYPPLDCAGVLDGHSVLAAARTDSETSNWAHSGHPGSSHVNLHIHKHNGISSVVCFTTLSASRVHGSKW